MKVLATLILLAVFMTGPVFASGPAHDSRAFQIFRKIRGQPRLMKQLQEIVQVAIHSAYGQDPEWPQDLDPVFSGRLSLFVTAKKKWGRPRLHGKFKSTPR